MKTSAAGVALIQQFEGLRLAAYQDAVGVWTIGYGHTGANDQSCPRAALESVFRFGLAASSPRPDTADALRLRRRLRSDVVDGISAANRKALKQN